MTAAMAALLVGAPLAQAAADGQNPLGKALELLDSSRAKVVSEDKAEQKAVAGRADWRDDAESNDRNGVATGDRGRATSRPPMTMSNKDAPPIS